MPAPTQSLSRKRTKTLERGDPAASGSAQSLIPIVAASRLDCRAALPRNLRLPDLELERVSCFCTREVGLGDFSG